MNNIPDLPYVKEKGDMFKAVTFSAKMIWDGEPVGLANYKASKYYNVEQKKVAHYIGKWAYNRKVSKYTRNPDYWKEREDE